MVEVSELTPLIHSTSEGGEPAHYRSARLMEQSFAWQRENLDAVREAVQALAGSTAGTPQAGKVQQDSIYGPQGLPRSELGQLAGVGRGHLFDAQA